MFGESLQKSVARKKSEFSAEFPFWMKVFFLCKNFRFPYFPYTAEIQQLFKLFCAFRLFFQLVRCFLSFESFVGVLGASSLNQNMAEHKNVLNMPGANFFLPMFLAARGNRRGFPLL